MIQPRTGTIEIVYKIIDGIVDPVGFYSRLKKGKDSFLLESADIAEKYGQLSTGCVDPALKIIIGNMGMPFIEQTLSMVAKHKNVYADLTIRPGNVWQTYNTVMAAYERSVMGKLLFGSGFPLGNAGECIEALLGFNMLLADTKLPTVPRGSIRNIIERNTLELLGIKDKGTGTQEEKTEKTKEHKSVQA